MSFIFALLFLVSVFGFVLGLIKPTFFSRFVKNPSRKKLSIIFIIAIIVFFNLTGSTTKNNKETEKTIEPVSLSNNVGKYGYNKTNGVYIGKIISVKQCKTAPEIQCYEIDQGAGYSRPSEHPVDNVTVKDQSTQPTQSSAPTSTPIPITKNKVDYEIVSSEKSKAVENYWLLLKSEDRSKQTLEEFARGFTKEKCGKECTVSLYDDIKALNLDRDYYMLTGTLSTKPEDLENWKKKNYVYVADHLIGYLSFDIYQEYPFKDWYYKQLIGE